LDSPCRERRSLKRYRRMATGLGETLTVIEGGFMGAGHLLIVLHVVIGYLANIDFIHVKLVVMEVVDTAIFVTTVTVIGILAIRHLLKLLAKQDV
jgi:hypothetical protein